MDDTTRAKWLLVMCGFYWGVNWPLIKIGLTGFTPWTYRLIVFSVGVVTLMAGVKFSGRKLTVPRGFMTWLHLFMSCILNIAAFSLLSTFAMLTATTSRVAVVSYSFPVWACLLAWLILGEKLRGAAALGLALCACGLVVLIYPVIDSSAMIGLGLSLGSAMTWAVGTVYSKLVRIPGDMLTNTAWQVVIAAVAVLVCTLAFQGWPSFEPVPVEAIGAAIANGFLSAVSYFLWYYVIERLPAMTAALGSLTSPAVGVLTAALILGERPPLLDMIGFAMIFGAAVCAILQPRDRTPVPTPEPEIHK